MSRSALPQVVRASGTSANAFDSGRSLSAKLGCSRSNSDTDYSQESNPQIWRRRNMFLGRRHYAAGLLVGVRLAAAPCDAQESATNLACDMSSQVIPAPIQPTRPQERCS